MNTLTRVLMAAAGAALIAGCAGDHNPRYGKGNDHQSMNSYKNDEANDVVYVRPAQPAPQPTVVYVTPAPVVAPARVVTTTPVYTYTTPAPVRVVPAPTYYYTN
jgi:hypothetical protein